MAVDQDGGQAIATAFAGGSSNRMRDGRERLIARLTPSRIQEKQIAI